MAPQLGGKIKPLKPFSLGRRLSAIPGLSEGEQHVLRNVIAPYVMKRVEEGVTWTKQDPVLRDAIVADVKRKWPWLDEKYEGCWPLHAYIPTRIRTSTKSSRPKEHRRKMRSQRKGRDEDEHLEESELEVDELMENDDEDIEDHRSRQVIDPPLASVSGTQTAVGSTSSNRVSASVTLTERYPRAGLDVTKTVFVTAKGTASTMDNGTQQAHKIWTLQVSDSEPRALGLDMKTALLDLNEFLNAKLEKDDARELEMSLYARWRS